MLWDKKVSSRRATTQHFKFVKGRNSDGKEQKFAECKYCAKRFVWHGSTSSLKYHIEKGRCPKKPVERPTDVKSITSFKFRHEFDDGRLAARAHIMRALSDEVREFYDSKENAAWIVSNHDVVGESSYDFGSSCRVRVHWTHIARLIDQSNNRI